MLEMYLRKLLPPNTQFEKLETVQSLWSGYGEIARYAIKGGNSDFSVSDNAGHFKSKQLPSTLIVKYIQPPTKAVHPKGWNTDISHQRKVASYVNESQFYQWYSAAANSADSEKQSSFADEHQLNTLQPKVPEYYGGYCSDGECQNFQACLLLEDLDALGFVGRANSIDQPSANHPIIVAGIKWLANFHAVFLQQKVSKVWQVGTYWHLATRPDEWAAMPESKLKDVASQIDEKLNRASFQTLVHGDAKLANFCFKEHDNGIEPTLAAVDFQYVGRGAGIKDIVYFLGSCLYQNDLALYFDSYVDAYFSALSASFDNLEHANIDIKALELEWRELIPYAFADFERFLVGWSPNHAKLCAFSEQQSAKALSLLP